MDLPEVDGFEMLEEQMKLQKLNKEIVDASVSEIVVYDRKRMYIEKMEVFMRLLCAQGDYS